MESEPARIYGVETHLDGSSHYPRRRLIEQATLSREDLHEIAQCRGSHNCLGFAYQIGFVYLENRFPIQRPFEKMDDLLQFISAQTGIEPDEIHKYASHQQTISQHQIRIRQYLDLKELVHIDTGSLKRYIFEQSCRLEKTSALYSLVGQYLKDHSILQPADSTLQRIIGEQRRLARQHIYEKITNSLSREIRQRIDIMLEVEEGTVSSLQKLKAVPRTPSSTALLELTHKLDQIAFTGVQDVDLSWLNNNYQRVLTNYVQRCSAHQLREIIPSHRYAAITCFLCQTYRDTIDQIVDMYDKLINKVYGWAQDDLDEAIKRKRKSIQRVLAMFASMGEVLLDEANISDDCVRKILFSKFSQEEMAERLEQSREWTTGRNSHIFHGVMGRFTYLRQFSKNLLESLEFESSQGESSQVKLISLLDAIETLKEMNQTGKRNLTPEAPIAFVPNKFKPFIGNNGELDKETITNRGPASIEGLRIGDKTS